MIILRELCEKDAENMLEWMHDPDSQKGFQKNMMDMTLEDARLFCRESKLCSHPAQGQNMHFAIADDADEYLGTISLKNINLKYHSAEYAITVRKKVRGRGVAMEATRLLLKKGFEEMGLHRIYLTVFADNIVAIKFYEKCGFSFEGELRDHIFLDGKYISWKLYGMLENEYSEKIFERNVEK